MTEVVCELCPKYCRIPEGGSGDCRIRVNLDGKLRVVTYGRPSAIHVDPMEKKPLFHFRPGTPVFSIATAGCNLHCKNCQNWQLSQKGGEEMEVLYRAPPDEVVSLAQAEGCHAIAYTYSDPIVFYEYVYDTSEQAHAQGMDNVFVTAGYINREPLRALCKVMDAWTPPTPTSRPSTTASTAPTAAPPSSRSSTPWSPSRRRACGWR